MGTEIARKLATIRKIAAVDPIKGADRIVCATVDGWKLVTQKSNNFQVGDLVVYFEIDSFLPIHPAFDWLYDGCYKNVEGLGPGYRLRTIKLRGQISQGLILPLRRYPDDQPNGGWWLPALERRMINVNEPSNPTSSWDDPDSIEIEVHEGDDVTDLMRVRKYEPPIPAQLAGLVKSTFPSWIHKTDQERAQNLMSNFRSKQEQIRFTFTDANGQEQEIPLKPLPRWQDYSWEVTMKLDGSSCTIYIKDDEFGVCSRNMDLIETETNSFWRMARKYDLEAKMRALGRNFAIQGELMGPGVQGNRENLQELELFVFDIFNIDSGSYLEPSLRRAVVGEMGLRHVPLIADEVNLGADIKVEDLLGLANINSLNHLVAEGIVFKCDQDPNISFKVINDRFLLDEGN